MSDGPAALIADGDAALAKGDWQAAGEAYSASLTLEGTPEGMFGLGNALWWLGDLEGSLSQRERAYATFLARPDPGSAFQAALLVILDYTLHVGNEAAARGWLGRARRLVERYDLEEMEGWLTLAEARQGPRREGAEDRLREALQQARTWGDADLELCAMSELGSVLVDQGNLEEWRLGPDQCLRRLPSLREPRACCPTLARGVERRWGPDAGRAPLKGYDRRQPRDSRCSLLQPLHPGVCRMRSPRMGEPHSAHRLVPGASPRS